ncbi:hypothetical protein TW95_gp0050 [Pandoravirus inopinatum]|uniref:Uncharacterized protein n=1 Tax=Pandoravirus inopinatum TaxID=1605721 RepID=A0A0B5J029_9VIRU|nr:hypothetical protein TW95_gp0050 [Pandoravirus inopinatum]AJF96784.1 hypothetical protein [Pandoravirus inopinatum]
MATAESTPHYMRDHLMVADFLPPGIVVVELHGLTYADAVSAPGQFTGIVKDLTSMLDDDYDGAPLLATCVMARRSRDDDDRGGGSRGPTDDDHCVVLCVAALPAGSNSIWTAFAVAARDTADRRFGVPHPDIRSVTAGMVDATLHGCFTRHSTIDSRGVVARNAHGARDCASCTHTWSGHRALSRKSLRRGPLGQMYSLGFHQSLLDRVTLGDIVSYGAKSIVATGRSGKESQEDVSRAKRSLDRLLVCVEGVLAACACAERFGLTRALSAVTRPDRGVGRILADSLDERARTGLALEPITRALVAASVVAHRTKIDAVKIIVEDAGPDLGTAEGMESFVQEWCAPRLAVRTNTDMLAFCERVAAFFMDLHSRPTMGEATHTRAVDATEPRPASLSCTRAPKQRRRRQPQEQRPDAKPATSTDVVACAVPAAPRCGSADCRVSGRRIATGCVVTVACTVGCQVAFHRACWKAAPIVCADHTPCPTPDCWGEIAQVTSVRRRASDDCEPHVLWRAHASRDPPPATPAPASPRLPMMPKAGAACGDSGHADDGATVHADGPVQDDPATHASGRYVVDAGEHRHDTERASQDDDDAVSEPVVLAARSGTPYHKMTRRARCCRHDASARATAAAKDSVVAWPSNRMIACWCWRAWSIRPSIIPKQVSPANLGARTRTTTPCGRPFSSPIPCKPLFCHCCHNMFLLFCRCRALPPAWRSGGPRKIGHDVRSAAKKRPGRRPLDGARLLILFFRKMGLAIVFLAMALSLSCGWLRGPDHEKKKVPGPKMGKEATGRAVLQEGTTDGQHAQAKGKQKKDRRLQKAKAGRGTDTEP